MANNRKTILLVEDDASVSLMEKKWLESEGYNVVPITSGEQAIKVVSKERGNIDLILMDINLGSGIDGADAAKEILKTNDLPILFLSSHDEEEIVRKTATIPSYGYVFKENKGTILLVSIKMAFRLYEAHKLLHSNQILLSEREKWFDETQRVAKIGSYKLNFKSGLWQGSKELKVIFGIDDKFICDVAGWLSLVHANDRAMMEEHLKSIVINKNFFNKEYRIVKASAGEERWVHGLGDIAFDSEGHPITMYGTIQDITENKLAEEHIKLSDERLDIAAKVANLVMWDWDIEKNNLLWDDSMYFLFGVDKDKFTSNYEAWLDTLHPDDKERCDNEIQNAVNNEKEFTSIFRVITSRGQLKYIKAEGSIIRNEAGKAIKMFGVNYDITGMKLAEKTIRLKDELIKMTGQITKSGGWEYDVESGSVIWTDEVATIYNLEPQHPFNLEVALSYYTDDSRIMLANALDAVVHEQKPYDLVLQFVSAAGEKKWVRTTGQPILERGKVVKLRGIFQDITDQKKIEDILYENENIFKAFMEYSPIYIFVKDNNARPVRLSKNFINLVGIPIEEMIGKSMEELFPSEMAKKMTMDDLSVLRENKSVKVIEELGGKFYETVKFPISIKGKPKYLAGFTMDITERLEDESRLKLTAEKLRESNITKDRLFSIIAHDLKGPFSGFIGLSDALASNLESLTSEEISTYAAIMHSTAKKIYELLNNLLEWSRLQSDKLEIKPIEINIYALVENIKNLFSTITDKKSVSIINNIDTKALAFADSNMVATILRNLISNAVKFTKSHGSVLITSSKQENFIEVSVSDDGVGMSKEFLEKLFKIEKGISTKGTANEEGSGLGLVLCKEMIEKNGGEIKVESCPDKGTTFSFTLPNA
ncbi:MAG: PAS domain-containing protein [Bacteroidota bacterium]|nr:PAS domain-containing protein [Bacteroidota bacterium]